MIIITGATGNLGQAVAERLLKLVPAAQLGVSVRNPEKGRSLRERDVRVPPGRLRRRFEPAPCLRGRLEGPHCVQRHRG